MFKFKISPAFTVPAILLNVLVALLLGIVILVSKYPPAVPVEEAQNVYYVDMLEFHNGVEHYSSIDFSTTDLLLARVTFSQQETILLQNDCSKTGNCETDSLELRLWHMDSNSDIFLLQETKIKY